MCALNWALRGPGIPLEQILFGESGFWLLMYSLTCEQDMLIALRRERQHNLHSDNILDRLLLIPLEIVYIAAYPRCTSRRLDFECSNDLANWIGLAASEVFLLVRFNICERKFGNRGCRSVFRRKRLDEINARRTKLVYANFAAGE